MYSLRDEFAKAAMQALLPTITEFPDEHWRIGIALDSYAMADAMLKCRGLDMEKERKAFEKWYKGDLKDWRGHDCVPALHAWEGWKARAVCKG